MRKTKLVITLGPALAEGNRLREALKVADAVRLNASHGDFETRLQALESVRRIAGELGRRIPVFLDLQGPKWRVGLMDVPARLEEGSVGVFFPPEDPAPEGFPWAVPLPHPELFRGAKTGQEWLLDDGNLVVRVVAAESRLVRCNVVVGGALKSRKGIHPVGLDVAIDPLTAKDLQDIEWGVKHGVDLFAQSFVRKAEDVHALQGRIREFGGNQPIIGKIEHPLALENLEDILEACWGIMVARGDLGVELGVEHVPAVQKQIIRKARKALKPVITATQMLESMIENASPTRAEASDVANAIWDGTDAVMLSAESAAGKHPLEAIRWLAKIAEDADEHHKPSLGRFSDALTDRTRGNTEVAVAFSACYTALQVKARWIVVLTMGGGSARMVSRLAPDIPVLALTPDEHVAHCVNLLRGVQSRIISKTDHLSELLAQLKPKLQEEHGLQPGDTVVLTLGHPLGKTGATNTMRVMSF